MSKIEATSHSLHFKESYLLVSVEVGKIPVIEEPSTAEFVDSHKLDDP